MRREIFSIGFDIIPDPKKMTFHYGREVFGPKVEKRKLDNIRQTLNEPDCDGPEVVYAIAMDVGLKEDREDLVARNLLYGAVIYAGGRLGSEPVRSQGHVHALSPSCGSSTAEVYEIWQGKGIVYMQESVDNDPGRCFAITATCGDVVIVPPGWGHMTISADDESPLAFGAWCVRDYRFDYKGVRSHKGLAWFPLFEEGRVVWQKNPLYRDSQLIEKGPKEYTSQGLTANSESIYNQYRNNPELFIYLPHPGLYDWNRFVP